MVCVCGAHSLPHTPQAAPAQHERTRHGAKGAGGGAQPRARVVWESTAGMSPPSSKVGLGGRLLHRRPLKERHRRHERAHVAQQPRPC